MLNDLNEVKLNLYQAQKILHIVSTCGPVRTDVLDVIEKISNVIDFLEARYK